MKESHKFPIPEPDITLLSQENIPNEEDFEKISSMYTLPNLSQVTWENFVKLIKSHEIIVSKLQEDIKEVLLGKNMDDQHNAVKLLKMIPDEEQRLELRKLISPAVKCHFETADFHAERSFDDDRLSPLETVIDLISYAPEADRADLIRTAFATKDFRIQSFASTLIELVPVAERKSLLAEWEAISGLGINEGWGWEENSRKKQEKKLINTEIVKEKLCNYFSYRSSRVLQGLLDVAKTIEELPVGEQKDLRDILLELIMPELEISIKHGELSELEAELIACVCEQDRFELILKMLSAKMGMLSMGKALKLAEFLSEEHRNELNRRLLKGKEDFFEVLATKTPLYDNAPKTFRSSRFIKDGSGTTLLDRTPGADSLKGRAIIRHVSEISYLAWFDAFSSYKTWKDEGFEYVPIEPIIRSKKSDRKFVIDVATQVLGVSVGDWIDERGA